MPASLPSAALAARHDAARDIIARAGDMALEFFSRHRSLPIESKTDGQDLVSIADREVETLIRDEIAARFPGDGIVGEEHGLREGSTGYRWIIDPIDGTSAFLHGLETWTVVIAIVENGNPVLGLIAQPCAGALYWAQAGGGAWRNDRPLAVDTKTPFTSGLSAIGPGNARHARETGRIVTEILEQGGNYMRNGSAALSLAYVAQGSYLGFYEPELSAWDCMAGLLLVREAGGIADDPFTPQTLLHRLPCLATAPQAAGCLRKIIGG
ncbi:inositol monophosphatase family protein [Pelagibacterium mangrovi]|uniref:inositol monophosphatase family protein n=1 Tax=Pelagibacterium mangrovi TaxID=3119828 RepID=UPI002FC831D7